MQPGWPAQNPPPPGQYSTPAQFGASGGGAVSTSNVPFVLTWIGLGMLFVSSFLPWVTTQAYGYSASVAGTDANAGKTTAVLAFIAAGLFGWSLAKTVSGNKGLRIGAIVAAALCTSVYLYNFADLANAIEKAKQSSGYQSLGYNSSFYSSSSGVNVAPGIGLIMGPLGGVLAVIGIIVIMRRATRPRAAAVATPLPPAWSTGGGPPQA